LKEAVAAIPSLEKNNNMGRAARERVKDATPKNYQVSLFRFIKNYWIKNAHPNDY
jgi:hypothetical protein